MYLRSECENDVFISSDIEDVLALIFADDVTINLIERFCKSVGMNLNLSKTKIIVFRNLVIVKDAEKWL